MSNGPGLDGSGDGGYGGRLPALIFEQEQAGKDPAVCLGTIRHSLSPVA